MGYSENFANNVKKLREKRSITQRELAYTLGYSEKTVSKWECGASVPPIDTIFKIANRMGVSVEALFASDERYYLAIDGGGTKTAMLLADREGRVLRTHRTIACNPVDIGFDAACRVLSEGINEICRDIPRSGIVTYAGISGGTSAGMRERLHAFFERQGFAAFDNDSDSMNIISAGLGSRDGIAMIMGTGICAFTYIGGEVSRIAGWGYLIDDGGSGYNLGRDALAAYFSALDGSGEPTLIVGEIDRAYSGGATEIMKYIYSEGKRAVASFAPAVYAAIERGDVVAREILNRNMRFAAKIAETARSKFLERGRIPLVVAGGLTEREMTMNAFREALSESDGFEISILDREPVYGALEMAMSLGKEI